MVKMINPPLLQAIGYQSQEVAILGFRKGISSDFTQLFWPLVPAYFILNTIFRCRLQKTESNWHVMKVSQTTLHAQD